MLSFVASLRTIRRREFQSGFGSEIPALLTWSVTTCTQSEQYGPAQSGPRLCSDGLGRLAWKVRSMSKQVRLTEPLVRENGQAAPGEVG